MELLLIELFAQSLFGQSSDFGDSFEAINFLKGWSWGQVQTTQFKLKSKVQILRNQIDECL